MSTNSNTTNGNSKTKLEDRLRKVSQDDSDQKHSSGKLLKKVSKELNGVH